MFTSQRPQPSDDPEFMYQRILQSIDFARILMAVANGGTTSLTAPQRTSLAELARLAACHPDPRLREKLDGAMTKLRASHLEHCLKKS